MCISIIAMQDLNPKFKSFSYSKEMKYIAKMMGYLSPILVQSMYIFKNPRIGGEVGPHTDNTYIRTNPLSCAGIWVAFDDASKENGCMWGVPGSHKTPTDYFLKLDKTGTKTYYEPANAPQYDISNAVPLEVEKGSVVLLHGDFVHFSHPNTSSQQRHAYTLHLVESRNHTWEADNWLQRKTLPFNFLNETDGNSSNASKL
jgi:phytanoyl-CoA hydroxylase